MSTIAIGVIGLGGMARAHIQHFKQMDNVTFAAICDVNEQMVQQTGDDLGIPADKRYDQYMDVIRDADVDVVVSITPNHMHAEILRGCLQEGKPFLAEKPLTRTFEEAAELRDRYHQRPVPSMISFVYRYHPSFRYAKALIESGKVGNVRHFFIQYLQGWGAIGKNTPWRWRFSKKVSGTGVLGDLGSHMIDTARFLMGEFKEVSAMMKTIVSERHDDQTGKMRPVDVDDFSSFQARMENDVLGVFQTSRNAFGSNNQQDVSIYGDTGTLHFSTEQEGLIWIHDDENGETVREHLQVPPQYNRNQWDEFVSAMNGTPSSVVASFMDGYYNQEVMEAIIRSAQRKQTVHLRDIDSQ